MQNTSSGKKTERYYEWSFCFSGDRSGLSFDRGVLDELTPDPTTPEPLGRVYVERGIKEFIRRFRHANSSIMDGWNVPLKVRQQRLGLSDPRLTLGTYTHVAGEDELRIASQLGKAISGEISCPVLPN